MLKVNLSYTDDAYTISVGFMTLHKYLALFFFGIVFNSNPHPFTKSGSRKEANFLPERSHLECDFSTKNLYNILVTYFLTTFYMKFFLKNTFLCKKIYKYFIDIFLTIILSHIYLKKLLKYYLNIFLN